MKNIRYIVDDKKNEISAILQMDDFNEIESYLTYRLIVVLCPTLFQMLEIPAKAVIFLNLLLQHDGYKFNQEVNLKDEWMVNKRKKIGKSTVKNHRRELKTFMKANNLAIIDIDYNQVEVSREIGTAYNLRFISVLKSAIREFSQSRDISIKDVVRTISYIEKNEDSLLATKNNNVISELIKCIEEQIPEIKFPPKINETEQMLKNKL